MARPIVWALGILASAVVSSAQIGDSLKIVGLAGALRAPAADASADPNRSHVLTLAADTRGHFSTFAIVDGVSVKVLVDTGATSVALPRSVAQRAGLRFDDRDFRRPASTANGVVMTAPVRISEIRLDSIVVRNVEAVVFPDAALGTTLLGMSFLSRLDHVEMARGRLNLRG